MKFNIKKYLYSLFGLVALQQANAQVVFKEDFGQSSTRVESQYVPQGGADSKLGNFDHGSSFYKFAQIITTNPWDNNKNQWSNLISDGYYAVIDPRKIYEGLPAGKPEWATWWVSKQDHTGNANGAALVVNAGQVLNQFYRRAVALEKGKTYKISTWIMSSGTQSYPKLIFEAQNILTEASLGKSNELTIGVGSTWRQLSWSFKIPNSNDCGNIAIALRNQSNVTGGNDFYLDDIVLEEVVDPTAEEIKCGSLANFDNLIKPENDIYKWGTGNYMIHTNDKVSVSNTMVPIVLSGATKNATISTIGNWPTGITLDKTTGEVKVASGTIMPTAPLEYQVCSLIGVCSKATVTFIPLQENLAITGVVTNQCDYNQNSNVYTLTIKNNLNTTFVASSATALEISFTIDHFPLYNSLDNPTSNNSDHGIWKYTRSGVSASVPPLTHTFKLMDGQVIPANGSITLTFTKNWNLVTASDEQFRRSLDIKMNVSNSSGNNIDKDLSDNSLLVSVFKTTAEGEVPNLTTKVSQYQKITVGEAAGLGENTSGYTFYTKINGIDTVIPSNYLIPTDNKGESFSFSYKSECKVYLATVTVPIGFSNPGTISTASGSLVNSLDSCFGGAVTIYNNTAAASDPSGKAFTYSWEVSKDNGTNWLPVSSADDNYINSTTNQLTIVSLLEDILVRRVAKLTDDNVTAVSNVVKIKSIKNDISIATKNFSIQKGTSIVIPSITTSLPSNIIIKDHNGVIVSQGDNVLFSQVGTYTITVEATNTNAPLCSTKEIIMVEVYDIADCGKITEKVMVKTEDWSTVPVLIIPGVVSNRQNAVDNDLSTHSTLTIPIGALGLGTTWHNLRFDHNVTKGTPVTVKLGQEYSAVQVGGGVTVQALDVNGKTIGPLLAAGDGALLDLLVGDNVFEYTFIPKDNNGNLIDYKGVRVVLGSTLAIANSAKVFGAYYEKQAIIDVDNPTCSTGKKAAGASKPNDYPHTDVALNPMVDDVLWGVEDVGLGVASSLASIVYPYLAADNDLSTYAIFNKSVAALNRQKLTVKFNQVARPGDQIRILMGGFEVPVLDLSLLTDIKIQRYLGDVKVGPQVDGSQFKILDLNLLALLGSVGNRKALIVDAIQQPFDRVEITYLSTVQVGLLGDYTYIYDVALKPNIAFDNQLPNNPDGSTNTTELCALDYLRVEKPDLCTGYEIAFAYANKDDEGNVTSFTDIENSGLIHVSETDKEVKFEFNSLHGMHTDNLYLKVRVYRQGCPFGDYQYIKVNIVNCHQSIVNPVLKLGV